MTTYEVSIRTMRFTAEDELGAVEQYANELGCTGDIPEWFTPNVEVEVVD